MIVIFATLVVIAIIVGVVIYMRRKKSDQVLPGQTRRPIVLDGDGDTRSTLSGDTPQNNDLRFTRSELNVGTPA